MPHSPRFVYTPLVSLLLILLGSEADGFQRFGWSLRQAAPAPRSLQGLCCVMCFVPVYFFFYRSTGLWGFFLFFLIFQLELMKVMVQTNKFPLKWDGLLVGKNVFPAEATHCEKSFELCWPCPRLLFMHRLINWKPRLCATHWTLCGTRRSPTWASRRRTCTAKRSGKCFLRSPPLFSPLSGSGFQKISYHPSLSQRGFFCSLFKGPYPFPRFPLYRSAATLWSISHLTFPPVLLSTTISKDLSYSFTAVPLSLSLFPCFSPSPVFKLQWQIEVRLKTAGCFNFIDPPPEVTKAANCFCLWLKLYHSTRGSGF